jgi:hypothetical protein
MALSPLETVELHQFTRRCFMGRVFPERSVSSRDPMLSTCCPRKVYSDGWWACREASHSESVIRLKTIVNPFSCVKLICRDPQSRYLNTRLVRMNCTTTTSITQHLLNTICLLVNKLSTDVSRFPRAKKNHFWSKKKKHLVVIANSNLTRRNFFKADKK